MKLSASLAVVPDLTSCFGSWMCPTFCSEGKCPGSCTRSPKGKGQFRSGSHSTLPSSQEQTLQTYFVQVLPVTTSGPRLPTVSFTKSSDSMGPHGLWPIRLLYPWDSPGKNTGVGCLFFCRRAFQPRDRTHVSCTAGGYLPSEPPCVLSLSCGMRDRQSPLWHAGSLVAACGI